MKSQALTLSLCLTVAGMLALTTPAGAIVLTPGNSDVTATSFSGAPGTLIATATSSFTSVLGASDFSGSVTEDVYKDSGTGMMDFVYQFSNNAASGKDIDQMTIADFGGYINDAYESTGPVFDAFTASSNTSSGVHELAGTISWDYTTGMVPGATSAIVMIKTNAPTYAPGTISFIDQGTATLTDFMAPATAPEPSFIALLGLGLAGIVGAVKQSRRKQAE